MHGGGPPVKPGIQLHKDYTSENVELVRKGLPNLHLHIQNGVKHGLPVVVAINKFTTDTPAELDAVREGAEKGGASAAVVCNHWSKGGCGAVDLADAVIKACEKPSQFKFLYDASAPLEEKVNIIAREMYGAGKAVFSDHAKDRLEKYTEMGYGEFPICMAKTSNSVTSDPNVKGAPKGFELPITDASVSVGAGFVICFCGEISRMPGLGIRPSIYDMDLDTDTGIIHGLF